MTDLRFWKVLGRLIRWNACKTMSRYYFFLTLVQLQPPREKAWFRFWGRWRRLVSSPSSLIRRVIKLRHGMSRDASTLFGKRRILSAPCHRRHHLLQLHKAAGGRRPPSLQPGGRGLMAGIEEMPAARKKMVAGGIWMLARSLFFFSIFFSLSSWDSVHIYLMQLSLCW